MITTTTATDIFYPSEDDEPLAETQLHALAILTIFNVLSLFLQGKPVVLFVDQFLYYREGDPSARVAPDVMLVFDIPQQFYDNYKVWEYGQIPAVIFEVTSASTRENDQGYKKELYERLGVKEYWLFDPKGEWIGEQLRGYRLGKDGRYEIIEDRCSEVLQLRLQPCDYVLNFYRLDNNEKLLTPQELFVTLQAEKERADRLAQKLRELGISPE